MDLDDVEGDASYRRTLPLRAGPGAARLVVVSSVALFVVALAPFAVRRPTFAIVVLPAAGHVWVSHTTGNAVWRL